MAEDSYTLRSLADARARDADDPLRALRAQFDLPEGMIYLDGNSLGALPRATPGRVAQVTQEEWGRGLIRSWNAAGWVDLPQRLGNTLAPLIGARENEVVICDSTSVNLYKVLHAAATIAKKRASERNVIVSERENFPTDNYIAQAIAKERGLSLRLVSRDDIAAALDDSVAVLMLTHVNYRTGAMHNMQATTAAAHAAGVLTIWDLAHSAGALPVHLHEANADFAIGCGYKYLNGGPGAPAFVWVHPRHVDACWQPLSGWFAHRAPFEFSPYFAPSLGINRYLCGTPPVLSMSALKCGLDVFASVPGGMVALREKSIALTQAFMTKVESLCPELTLVTPRLAAQRGSHVSFTHAEHGYAIMQALIARGVVGDFRAPDILRFGFAPLYIGFEDVWLAGEQLRAVVEAKEYLRPEFQTRKSVT